MKSFFTTPIALKAAFVISIIIYVMIKLWLNNLPPIFKNANEIGNLISEICLAFITGYFFYVIVNQLKEDKDKKNVHDFIEQRISQIFVAYNYLISQMIEVTNFNTSQPPTKEEVNELLVKIRYSNNRPQITVDWINHEQMTWFEFMILQKNITQKEINKLYILAPYLDSHLIDVCSKIDECRYFDWIDKTKMLGKNFNQFDMVSNDFYTYTKFCTELQRYAYQNNFIPKTKDSILIKRILSTGIPKDEIDKMKNNNA